MSIPKQDLQSLQRNDNFGNLKESESKKENTAKEVLKKGLHAAGDALESIGDKVEHAGFKKIGDGLERLGDKIEHLAG